jgi:hypothetical protein
MLRTPMTSRFPHLLVVSRALPPRLLHRVSVGAIDEPLTGGAQSRFRPVTDACRAPVLPDQGLDRRPGTASRMQAFDQPTPCSQSQIGCDRHLQRCDAAQVDAASALSVVVRSGPVETAVNGTLAWG